MYLRQMFRYIYPGLCYLTMIGEYRKDTLDLYQSYWAISKYPVTVDSLSDTSCGHPIYLLVEAPSRVPLSSDPYLRYNKQTIFGMCDAVSSENTFLLYAQYSINLSGIDWCYVLKSGALSDNLIAQPLQYYSVADYFDMIIG